MHWGSYAWWFGKQKPILVCKWNDHHKFKSWHLYNLPARNNTIGEEEWPDSEPSITILGNNTVLVADPVFIPTVDGSRVMDTKNVNVLDFETSTLELERVSCGRDQKRQKTCLANDPSKRARSISTREDVFVHEKTPRNDQQSISFAEVQKKSYQMRSSYCQLGRIPATWNTKMPSSSKRS